MKQRTLLSFFKTKKVENSSEPKNLNADELTKTKLAPSIPSTDKIADEIDSNSSVNTSTTVTPNSAIDGCLKDFFTVIKSSEAVAEDEHDEDENLIDSSRSRRSTRNKKSIIESEDEDASPSSADDYVPDEETENTFTTANSSVIGTSNKRKLKSKSPNQSSCDISFGSAKKIKVKPNTPLSTLNVKSTNSYSELVIPDKYSFLKSYKTGEKTVSIPQSSFANFTDFEKQYWNIKKDLMDVVLLFKKGKFYEVYENDALLANKKFDWKIAGQSNSGSFANSPQNSHGRAGMVMGGIPEMSLDYWINQFVSNGYKVGKVEQMESLLLKTMQNNNGRKVVERELECIFSKGSMDNIDDDGDSFIMSLKQFVSNDGIVSFKAHIADLSVNKFYYQTMNSCEELETFLLQISPKEIVLNDSDPLEAKIEKLIKFHVPNLQWSSVNIDSDSDSKETLICYLDYLKVKIPENIKFKEYYTKNKTNEDIIKMSLESNTLRNLEILKPTTMTKTKGSTLFSLINYTFTPMGQRLLKKWILSPLFQPKDIVRRQDSVAFLINDGCNDCLSSITNCFKSLPDMERLIGRLIKGNLPFKIFHEQLIRGFKSCLECFMLLNSYIDDTDLSFKSSDIYTIIKQINIDELAEELKYWNTCYKFVKNADGTNSVHLDKGVDEDFDELQGKIDALNIELDDLLQKYRKEFKNNKICYKNQGKEIMTLECPVEIVKKIPKDWTQTSMTKNVKRYYSPELQKMANSMLEFQELYKEHQKRLIKNLYMRFSTKKSLIWDKIIETISNLDCLASLAVASMNLGFPSCRPKIHFRSGDESFVNFKELRHPYTTATRSSFIPNDVSLNCNESQRVTILTGSNSSGKSTVLRMSSIAIIMGQLGMFVPASEAEFSPMDKVLTRLGSNDNLLQGKSTFLMELEDVANLLSEIDRHTFIIIDELGRGGSSKDGFALCESVLYEILTKSKAVGYFATHYNGLYKSFNEENVNFNKMTHFVKENGEIVFLYKISKGISESSMGLSVAKLCGIDDSIIKVGEKFAIELEHTSRLMRAKQFDETDYNNNSKMMSYVGLESDFEAVLMSSDLVTFGKDRSANVNKEALAKFISNIK